MASTPPAVKTLVFLDLEATGLKASGKPRVTEVCLLAVRVEDLKNMEEGIIRGRDRQSGGALEQLLVPRVLNKLVLCVYPMTTIMPTVTSITGLDNYNLTGQAVFDRDLVHSLQAFMDRLPKPACLLAHNGNKFDFPLLKAEMMKVGAQFDPDLQCCDTYIGIKDIFDQIKLEKEISDVENLVLDGQFDDDDEVLVPEVQTEPKTPLKDSSLLLTPPSSKRKPDSLKPNSKRQKLQNETTPMKMGLEITSTLTPGTPAPSYKRRESQDRSGVLKARKQLFGPLMSTPPSFSLSGLHTHLLGLPPQISHGAEADCLALMRVTASLAPRWLNWIHGKGNCVSWGNVEPMWGQKKCLN